jgi:RimJ/RimL family protein N-acetyltransferase
VQERAGTPLPPWKPATGDTLFTRESGAVAAQFHDPPAIEPYSSELVAAPRGIVLGKKSGLDSIRIKAAELGLDLLEERYPELLAEVKRVGAERHGLVTDDELQRLAAGEPLAGERIPFPREGLADDAVCVRRLRAEDAERMLAGLLHPDVVASSGMPPKGHTLESVLDAIVRQRPQELRTGEGAMLTIADRETDLFLGSFVLWHLNWDFRQAEIGYWIHPDARGRGVAARATALVADWALGKLGLHRLEAYVADDNPASVKTIERAGFVREGLCRSVLDHYAGTVDLALYARLASEERARLG